MINLATELQKEPLTLGYQNWLDNLQSPATPTVFGSIRRAQNAIEYSNFLFEILRISIKKQKVENFNF